MVDATYLPAATANDRAELGRIVHSIRFLSDSPQKPASAASGVVAASARRALTVRFVHFVLPGRGTECDILDSYRLKATSNVPLTRTGTDVQATAA
jgi:hypothetical protein